MKRFATTIALLCAVILTACAVALTAHTLSHPYTSVNVTGDLSTQQIGPDGFTK